MRHGMVKGQQNLSLALKVRKSLVNLLRKSLWVCDLLHLRCCRAGGQPLICWPALGSGPRGGRRQQGGQPQESQAHLQRLSETM